MDTKSSGWWLQGDWQKATENGLQLKFSFQVQQTPVNTLKLLEKC